MSELEKTLDTLLAKELGISPAEVSCETIHNWREEHLYPNVSYNTETRYGGYLTHTKKIISCREREVIRERVDEFLSHFSS
jgi:hypothetical protein